MSVLQKNLILVMIIGTLTSGIPAITLCSSHCVASNAYLDVSDTAHCSGAFHGFVQLGVERPSLTVAPLVNFLHDTKEIVIPKGFLLSIFKPPKLFF